jgi:hypothetical protein
MTTRPSPNVTLLDLVVLPLTQRQLLLPASALAEVLPKWQSRPLPETPQWCAGELEWRQRRLPLIDFERWSGGPDTPGRWLVVCNRSQDDLPFSPLWSAARRTPPATAAAQQSAPGHSHATRCRPRRHDSGGGGTLRHPRSGGTRATDRPGDARYPAARGRRSVARQTGLSRAPRTPDFWQ